MRLSLLRTGDLWNCVFSLGFCLWVLTITGCGGGGTLIPASTPTSDGSVWKGHNWKITTGGMAGVAQGNPANIFVDSNGYLHLRIINRSGTYTASEMFSTDNIGFGTYQWQIEGAIDNMDKSTVLGLFPYGPAAGIGRDGENELDIEFSKWDNTCGSCSADFTFYPSTGNKAVGPQTDNFNITLNGGTLTTARLVWTPTSVTGTIMSGLQPIGTTQNVLRTFSFSPADSQVRIPQAPLPLGMNFWCFRSLPASSQEVILRDFQYAPQKTYIADTNLIRTCWACRGKEPPRNIPFMNTESNLSGSLTRYISGIFGILTNCSTSAMCRPGCGVWIENWTSAVCRGQDSGGI